MTESTNRDQVFARPLTSVKAFKFDAQVTQVFDDMIARSVPGYELQLRLIALIADIFVTNESRIYDLGCSTGAVARVVEQQVAGRHCHIVGVDNSTSMIERCQRDHNGLSVTWICDNIEDITIEEASLVVLNLTLQFVEPNAREALLEKIYRGMQPGGALVLTEKIELDDAGSQRSMTELYQAFKKNQGYSDLEIAQKRSALEQVLIPDKRSLHLERLNRVGFSQVFETFHCFNFASFLAVK